VTEKGGESLIDWEQICCVKDALAQHMKNYRGFFFGVEEAKATSGQQGY